MSVQLQNDVLALCDNGLVCLFTHLANICLGLRVPCRAELEAEGIRMNGTKSLTLKSSRESDTTNSN